MQKTKFFLIFLLAFTITACFGPLKMQPPQSPAIGFIKAPIPPIIPNPVLSSLEETVNTEPIINKYVSKKRPIKKGATIGVMDFASSGQKGSGTLVSDTFSIHFFKQGLKVVERQNIKKIVEEQKRAASGMLKMSEKEIAKRIGKLTRADFILFGAVTQYHFENTKLPVPYKIDQKEYNKYLTELKTYKKQANQFKQQQSTMDAKQYEYIKKNLFYQIFSNDKNTYLHYQKKIVSSCLGPPTPVFLWKGYNSAKTLKYNYPYFSSQKVLPFIGIKQKSIDFKIKTLEQDQDEWNFIFKDFLKQYDKTITEEKLKNAISNSGSYANFINSDIKDNYTQNVENFCSEGTDKLKDYHSLIYQIKASKLQPIPENIKQFDLPPPQERFVSVANLGITFKVIDIKTGDIFWIGQATKRDLNIQKGLNEMISTVVKEIKK